jgi:hypothetical protein
MAMPSPIKNEGTRNAPLVSENSGIGEKPFP